MRKRISKKDIIEFVENKGFVFIDFIDYCGAKSIIKVICPKGHEPYEVSYATITRGNRASCGCPTCKKNKKSKAVQDRVKFETVREYVKEYGYELLTEEQDYKGVSNPIFIQCPNNHRFNISFHDFKKRKRNGKNTLNKCEFCFKEERIRKLKEKCDSLNYTLLTTEYTGKNQKIDIICDKGHEWHPLYDGFIRGKAKCLICNNELLGERQKLPWNKVIYPFNKEGYKVLSQEREYKNNQSKLKVICPKKHEYEVSYSNFLKGNRCPICNSSKGEEKVKNILEQYNVLFKGQYKFKDCKFYHVLAFDFYLPDYNCCIEYDGKQHYESVEFFGGYDGFVNTKIRDTIKNIYCDKNNIKLIRIPYWEFDNIEKILTKELNLK